MASHWHSLIYPLHLPETGLESRSPKFWNTCVAWSTSMDCVPPAGSIRQSTRPSGTLTRTRGALRPATFAWARSTVTTLSLSHAPLFPTHYFSLCLLDRPLSRSLPFTKECPCLCPAICRVLVLQCNRSSSVLKTSHMLPSWSSVPSHCVRSYFLIQHPSASLHS